MVLEHESISHNVDTHFLQIVVPQEGCELAGNFVLLEGFEIGAEPPLSKIRAELAFIPGAIIGEMIEIATIIGHRRIGANRALHPY